MIYDQLINKKFHILQRNKIIKDQDKFIYNEIANRINNSLEGINISVKNSLEIGFSSSNILNYILRRFKGNNHLTVDISQEVLQNLKSENDSVCFDHDNWIIDKKFDLIISNFYLNFSNNFNLLLKNINLSLNDNGFFLATIPGVNCFNELRNVMIKTDLEIYGGAYRRFNDFFPINYIAEVLKKNNFKIPVIEIDTIQLKYKKFSNLLNDVRNLGSSNVFNDRKKNFENKNYFKKAEKMYWDLYSNKKEVFLLLEVIFFSGWKEHHSQQKPLNPGEAKLSLKKILE